jgi:hypothetical protein
VRDQGGEDLGRVGGPQEGGSEAGRPQVRGHAGQELQVGVRRLWRREDEDDDADGERASVAAPQVVGSIDPARATPATMPVTASSKVAHGGST